jgi:hypothetical protein
MLFFFLYKLTDLFTVMRRELSNDHDILTTASSSEESLTITRTGRHGSDWVYKIIQSPVNINNKYHAPVYDSQTETKRNM